MLARAIFISVSAVCGLAAMSASWPSRAQGVLKPAETLIVNPPSKPVPVSIVPTAASATAICRFDLPDPGGGSTAGYSIGTFFLPLGSLQCPDGVTKLDVQRVVLVPGPYQLHYNVSIVLGRSPFGATVLDAPVATLSNGTPDLALARAVRIDKTVAGGYLINGVSCSVGLAGQFSACGGTVFLVGTPVN